MRGTIPLLLLVAGAALVGSGGAQDRGRYYPETGHTLDTTFVAYFDTHGGLEGLGYPITEAFIDPYSGWLIQYFQNTRMELVLDREGSRVRMPPLGEILGGWEPPLSASQIPVGSTPGCMYYPESSHKVCYAFWEYFDNNGGPARFGYPISEFKLENGRLVQYFQGFRLDWHPEAASTRQVQVAPLGRVHFETMGYDRELLEASPPDNMINYRVISLRPRVSVLKPVVRATDAQEIYVVVTDQNLNPVGRAGVTLIAHFADQERVLVMPQSDEQGLTKLVLRFENQPPGTHVTLEAWVVFGELLASTRDSFQIWW